MKKHILLLLFFLSVTGHISRVVAVTVTPTAKPTTHVSVTPTADIRTKDLSDLESKIASLAAEKHVSEPRGIIGDVKEVTNSQLSLTDSHGNLRIVHVDELTKFSNPNAKGTFGISDITKGMNVGILGLYYKDTRIIIARFVTTLTIPMRIHGVITDIDSKNYYLSVTTNENKQVQIDVQNFTKTTQFSQGKEIKAGFSKNKIGESIVVSGYPDAKVANRIIASYIILLPDVLKNPKITASIPVSVPATPTK